MRQILRIFAGGLMINGNKLRKINMKTGIYGIHNVKNGKWHVGQSTNIPRRKTAHFSYLRANKHHNQHLQLSYNKYGQSSFEFMILEEAVENMMDIRERVWINYYESTNPAKGYNLDSGGNLNKHHSAETRSKMGRPCTVWKRLKQSQTAIAAQRHPTKETIKKLQISQKLIYAKKHPFYPQDYCNSYKKAKFH